MKLRRLLKSRPALSKVPKGLDEGANENISPYAIRLDLRPETPGWGERALVWTGQLAALVLVAALSFWSGSHYAPAPKPAAAAPHPIVAPVARDRAALPREARTPVRKAADAPIPGPRYVRRTGSILREEPKASGHKLKKETKGARVTLEVLQRDGWAKVTDGAITGYMRANVLGPDKP